MANLKVRHAVA